MLICPNLVNFVGFASFSTAEARGSRELVSRNNLESLVARVILFLFRHLSSRSLHNLYSLCLLHPAVCASCSAWACKLLLC